MLLLSPSSPSFLSSNIYNNIYNISQKINKVSFFVGESEKNKKKIISKEGQNLLEVLKKNNVKIDGACEGNCACATCHVILPKKLYDTLPPPSLSEEDTLDQAPNLTDTSRLSCQLYINSKFGGCEIKIPQRQRNLV